MLKNTREFGSCPSQPSLSTAPGLGCTDLSFHITSVSLGNRRNSETGHSALKEVHLSTTIMHSRILLEENGMYMVCLYIKEV